MESGSLKMGCFSARQNISFEALSRSSREEDDLHWAALQKLPTYNRLRRAVFTTSGGEATEIDVNDLGFLERKSLVERLMTNAEDDSDNFLMKLRNRIDRVGIELPTIEVRFENLNVEGEAYIGSRALPTFLNFFSNIVEVL